ncbi:MAG: hypothetical protein IPL61_13825 [Myxococcales bacterium]|nr:hypothetical protein [Myxococcales bacterium]
MGCLRARVAIAAGLIGLAGCGASTTPAVTARPERDPAAPEDLTIDAGEVALTGVRFEPEAIAAPSMLLVHGTRTPSLERLRSSWAKTRADRRASVARRTLDGELLVTALFEAARTDAARRDALLAEARAAVAALHSLAPGATDETTLIMGAALAFATGDPTGAEPYLTELAQRFADRPGGAMARTQLAFARLRDGDDAIAGALVGDATPTAAQPELAYVIAWVRFRAGDGPGAAAAITLAAQGWTVAAAQAAIDRDFVVMHARSGLPLETAVDAVAAVTSDAARRHALLYQLSTAAAFAGRPDLARGALDAALAALPAPPTELLPSVRLLQAEYVRRAGRIDDLASAWRAAVAAVGACSGCSADDRQAVGDGLAARAVEAHTIFATSGDARYQRAAAELYRLFAALPDVASRRDHAAVAQYAADFARVRAPADGAQYRDALKVPLALRQQEVLACYEATLQGTPAVGGALTLVLEIDAAGAVIGATTDPARGAEGLAQVAGCVEERARAWQLVARSRPGTARVTARYVLGARL